MFLGLLRPPPPFERASLPYLLLSCPIKVLLHGLHYLFNALRISPSPRPWPIRVVCISDTHAMIPEDIPPGDILIHAGDLTNDGTIPNIQKQIDWISKLPHPHKIAIAGNHDTYFDPRTRPSLKDEDRSGELDWKGIKYLQHSTATIRVQKSSDGSSPSTRGRILKVYGAPQIPACGSMAVFAFQYPPGSDAWTDTIPNDIDILVTHIPPKNHLDIPLPSGLGCEFLVREVKRVKPKLHVCGHVHWGAGQEVLYWDSAQAAHDRGLNRSSGISAGWLDIGLWLDVVRVVLCGTKAVIWEWVWGGESKTRTTRLVNAAQMLGNTGKLGTKVQVVDI